MSESEKISVWRNMAYMGMSHGVTMCFSAATMIIITRYYGPEEYGAYTMAGGIVAIISTLAGMGFQFIVVRDVAISFAMAPQLLAASAIMFGLNGILSAGILFILSYVIKFDVALSFWLLAASIILNSLSLLWSIFRAKENFLIEARVNIIKSICYLILVSTAIQYLYSNSIIDIVFIQFLINCFFFAFVYRILNKSYGIEFMPHQLINSIAFDKIAYLYKNGFYMMLISAGVVIYNKVDVIMIGRMLDNRAVGIYGVAYRVFEIISGIMIVFLGVLYPRLAKLIKHPLEFKKKIKFVFGVLIVIWLISGVVFYFGSNYLISIVFGKSYIEAAPVLQILGFVIGLGAISSFFGMLFRILKLEIYMAVITAIGACLNVLLNIYLIPRQGITGAGWATFASFLFITILCLINMKFPSQVEETSYGRTL